MDFEAIRAIENDAERTNRTYEIFDEDSRLDSKASHVEFLTTVRYIEKHLNPGMRILDLGAGTGAYSLYFAKKGYTVVALELADRNIAAFRGKLTSELPVTLHQGNAMDLSAYDDYAFDIVLCFGPLYHLRAAADRTKVIREVKRVCRKDGTMFFSFIGHDIVFLTELDYNVHYFTNGDYDHETMRLHDFPFVFFTPPECRSMLEKEDIHILHAVATDGASELMADKINRMTEEEYTQYLKYHEMICEKTELLGMSNHLLYVGQRTDPC